MNKILKIFQHEIWIGQLLGVHEMHLFFMCEHNEHEYLMLAGCIFLLFKQNNVLNQFSNSKNKFI